MTGTRTHVLDAHHHLGSLVLGSLPEGSDPMDLREDLRIRLERMDAAGIDTAVVMPVNRYLRPRGAEDTRVVNDQVAAYCALAPERLRYAVGISEPMYGEAGLEEIRRLSERGFIGVSYHGRWQGVCADDPWIVRQAQLARELGLLLIVHSHAESNLESPTLVANLARAMGDYPVLVTDAMSSGTQYLHYLDLAAHVPNLYFDTSCVYSLHGLVHGVRTLGASRFVFGSDTYSHLMYTTHTPQVISDSGLTPEETDALLCGSFTRLLARVRGDAAAAGV